MATRGELACAFIAWMTWQYWACSVNIDTDSEAGAFARGLVYALLCEKVIGVFLHPSVDSIFGCGSELAALVWPGARFFTAIHTANEFHKSLCSHDWRRRWVPGLILRMARTLFVAARSAYVARVALVVAVDSRLSSSAWESTPDLVFVIFVSSVALWFACAVRTSRPCVAVTFSLVVAPLIVMCLGLHEQSASLLWLLATLCLFRQIH